DEVEDCTAAALMLKGCTVECLVERCAKVQAGQAVLVWAAAGGVGQLLTGWLRAIGAKVIGVAGSPEKMEHARAAGAEHVIDHMQEDVADRVHALT
ncbi:zinc-binding dehydrogenase, partial [Streptococcus suis]